MQLLGVGTDVIEIRVVERLIGALGDRFFRVALRPAELASLPEPAGRPMYVARHLAAKEAGMKALGLGLGPSTAWTSFELMERSGGLSLWWAGAESAGVEFRVAVSRSADAVIATVWALRPDRAGEAAT